MIQPVSIIPPWLNPSPIPRPPQKPIPIFPDPDTPIIFGGKR